MTTPAPWKIEWYECRADRNDIKAGTAKKVGEILWKVPMSIGPISPDHNHWAGDHLSLEADDVYLVAAAPELLDMLEKCLKYGGIFPDLAEEARMTIAKAGGKHK